jgi:hypothetical protein
MALLLSVFLGLLDLASCRRGLSGPDSEAQELAERFVGQWVTKCGDRYYAALPDAMWAAPVGGLYEYKGVSVTVESLEISEADRLNGYEWEGSAMLNCRLARLYDGHAWGEWSEAGCVSIYPISLPPAFPLQMFKKQGKWFVGKPFRWGYGSIDTHAERFNPKKVDCSSVPR